MQVTAKLRYLSIAPRKVRLIIDLVRGKSVEQAQIILNFTPNRTAPILLKLLKQAVANAKNNFQLDEKNLYIQKITADEGPKLKRWRPRARGMAYQIQKKTSHITITLDEIEQKAKKRKKVKEVVKEKFQPDITKETKKTPEIEEVLKEKKLSEKPKLKPELEIKKPKIDKDIRRIFRRKAF